MLEVMSIFRNNNIDEKKKIYNIPINHIIPNPYQPRKNFDRIGLNELSESIKKYGVLQPIMVRKMCDETYELVAGERRLRACMIAGMSEIPSIIVNIDDNDSAILALIENLQREDLSFLEEAEGYYHLIKEHGLTQEELAQRLGKNQSTIANKLRLLKLSPIIKKIIKDNDLTERHARALLKLPDEQTQLRLLKTVCEKGLNVKKTEELVKEMLDNISGVEQGKPKEKTNIKIFRDIRIFVNTIKQTVEMMKKSGVDAQTTKFDKGDYIEYVIKIPK